MISSSVNSVHLFPCTPIYYGFRKDFYIIIPKKAGRIFNGFSLLTGLIVLLGFPEDQISENNTLNVVDVDGAAPTAELIHGAVFIGSGQSSACGEFRTIREYDFSKVWKTGLLILLLILLDTA